jgi:hypothetical protein
MNFAVSMALDVGESLDAMIAKLKETFLYGSWSGFWGQTN